MQKYYIYKIQCTANNRIYIGQTKNLNRRKREHFGDLRRNQHHSILLQRAFNKYGEESFIHSVIEECTKENVDEREVYWIDYYDSTNKYKGFNLEGGGNANKSISELTKEKQRENIKKIRHKLTEGSKRPEVLKRRSKAMSGEKNPMYGKTPKEWMDEETYKKWVQDKSERFKVNNPMKNGHTEESKRKISLAVSGEKNPFYGKTHSEETRRYLSEIRSGEKNPNAVAVLCLNNNKIYKTVTEASRKLGVDGSAISKVCRGKVSHTHGYKFEYVKRES